MPVLSSRGADSVRSPAVWMAPSLRTLAVPAIVLALPSMPIRTTPGGGRIDGRQPRQRASRFAERDGQDARWPGVAGLAADARGPGAACARAFSRSRRARRAPARAPSSAV
nr:hypothetical protein [Massilia sp. Gc5]